MGERYFAGEASKARSFLGAGAREPEIFID